MAGKRIADTFRGFFSLFNVVLYAPGRAGIAQLVLLEWQRRPVTLSSADLPEIGPPVASRSRVSERT